MAGSRIGNQVVGCTCDQQVYIVESLILECKPEIIGTVAQGLGHVTGRINHGVTWQEYPAPVPVIELVMQCGVAPVVVVVASAGDGHRRAIDCNGTRYGRPGLGYNPSHPCIRGSRHLLYAGSRGFPTFDLAVHIQIDACAVVHVR